MTGFLLVGSSPADLGLMTDSTVNSAHFDPNYTQRAVYNPFGIDSTSWKVKVEPEGGSRDLWYHVYFAGIGGNVGVGSGMWACYARDANDVIRAGWIGTGARTAAARAIGDSTVTGGNFDMTSTRFPVDVNIHVEPDKIVTEVYKSGTVVSRAEAATSTDIGPLKSFHFGPIRANAGNFADQITAQSEFIVTDGLPTVSMRLIQRLPDSPGVYSDMQGSYTNLADPNPAAGIVGNADGQRMSWGLSPVGATLGPAAIAAVLGRFTNSRMLGSPTRVNQFLRQDGADYDSPSHRTGLRKTDMDSWSVNPATGQKWVTSDFLDLEVGVRVTD